MAHFVTITLSAGRKRCLLITIRYYYLPPTQQHDNLARARFVQVWVCREKEDLAGHNMGMPPFMFFFFFLSSNWLNLTVTLSRSPSLLRVVIVKKKNSVFHWKQQVWSREPLCKSILHEWFSASIQHGLMRAHSDGLSGFAPLPRQKFQPTEAWPGEKNCCISALLDKHLSMLSSTFIWKHFIPFWSTVRDLCLNTLKCRIRQHA